MYIEYFLCRYFFVYIKKKELNVKQSYYIFEYEAREKENERNIN